MTGRNVDGSRAQRYEYLTVLWLYFSDPSSAAAASLRHLFYNRQPIAVEPARV